MKHPLTGGGPRRAFTPAESALIEHIGVRASVVGLEEAVDTDAPILPVSTISLLDPDIVEACVPSDATKAVVPQQLFFGQAKTVVESCVPKKAIKTVVRQLHYESTKSVGACGSSADGEVSLNSFVKHGSKENDGQRKVKRRGYQSLAETNLEEDNKRMKVEVQLLEAQLLLTAAKAAHIVKLDLVLDKQSAKLAAQTLLIQEQTKLMKAKAKLLELKAKTSS